jgi:hypothetical protein
MSCFFFTFLLCFLITRTADKVQKPNISESDTPSSESYSNYLNLAGSFSTTTFFSDESDDIFSFLQL